MKQNLEDGNPQMWDLFAYRIPRKKNEDGEDSPQERKGHENESELAEDKGEQLAPHRYRTLVAAIYIDLYTSSPCL